MFRRNFAEPELSSLAPSRFPVIQLFHQALRTISSSPKGETRTNSRSTTMDYSGGIATSTKQQRILSGNNCYFRTQFSLKDGTITMTVPERPPTSPPTDPKVNVAVKGVDLDRVRTTSR